MKGEKLLNTKLGKEISTLKEKMLHKFTAEEIFERAYEIAVKEQIKDEILFRDLTETQLMALLKSDNILDEFYNDWLGEDTRLGKILENSIDITLDIMEANFCKIKSHKIKER